PADARERGRPARPQPGCSNAPDRARNLSGEQPAERLAQIQREHRHWSIRHVTEGFGWTAHRGEARIWAGTLTGLDAQLREADGEAGQSLGAADLRVEDNCPDNGLSLTCISAGQGQP